jgi:hypothetical protein
MILKNAESFKECKENQQTACGMEYIESVSALLCHILNNSVAKL